MSLAEWSSCAADIYGDFLAGLQKWEPGLIMLSAPTGELGVSTAEAERPDVIITDINLPGVDGVSAPEKLRQNYVTKDVTVIVLSANAMPKEMERDRRAGGILQLPFQAGQD